jgi:stage II sporulation protein D
MDRRRVRRFEKKHRGKPGISKIPIENKQMVLACLLGICVLLIFLIFWFSNRKAAAAGSASAEYAVDEELLLAMEAEQQANQEVSVVPNERESEEMPRVDENTQVHILLLQDGEPLTTEIYFSANAPYKITFHGKTKTKKKKQVIHSSQLKLEVGESARVESDKGKLYLADASGERKTLGYAGSFIISRYEDGYAVVNEVDIESYLCGVVPSEMPAYFEEEALKAQAVCARTYIVKQLMADNYPEYGADVDDSVRFQVYNQVAADERVLAAVDATRGQLLTVDQLPINAYFFSTSDGVTNGLEIWGGEPVDYLTSVRGKAGEGLVDLSSEDAFRSFIDEMDSEDYDYSSSYYRWRASLDLSQDFSQIKTKLYGIDEAQPDCVIIRDSDGQELPISELEQWTEAVGLQVLERSAAGAVLRLSISCDEGSIEVSNEHYIRQVLGAWMEYLSDKDGNELAASGMLPSASFYVQPVKDGIVLIGGGSGHGIGMSQYGANGMAADGADMEAILSFYYEGAELTSLYE